MANMKSSWVSIEPQIEEALATINQMKKDSRGRTLGYGLLLSAVIAIVLSLFVGLNVITLVCSLAMGIGIMYFYYYTKRNEYYKSTIMPCLVDSLCPGATYEPNGTIPVEVVGDSKLINVTGLSYTNEDTIRGKVDKTDFVYGEMELYHYTGSGKNRQRVTDFKGYVFEADFNKYFNGITLLTSQSSKFWGMSLFSNFERCTLEDPEFEDRFRTITTNDQEARYILTPALQQRILTLNDTLTRSMGDSNLSMSFHDSRMLIMVPSYTDHFEVKYTPSEVEQDFKSLSVMLDIVDILNLNLRIWTKE